MERDQLTHIALVTEVEKHECLYNTSLPDYGRKDITEEAWAKISDTLKLPVAECKEKWRNIRSTYRRSFKPARNGKSKKRTYYLSRYLNFVLPYCKPLSDSILNEADNEDNDFMVVLKDVDLDSENSMGEEIYLPTTTQTRTPTQNNQDLQDENGTDVKFEPNPDERTNNSPHAMSSEEDFTIPEHLKRKSEEKDCVMNNSEHMKYFFLSLLPEFKNMSEKQTRTFKIKVLQLIDDIKNGDRA